MKAMWTILLLVLLIGHTMPVLAQGPVNLSIDGVQYDASSQARAYVTVRNENGVPIMGLQAAQFEIVEDGKTSFPPAQVEAQSNPEATISIVMVIDISGSMKGKPIKEAMRAANALIDQMSPQDRGAIIAFADQVNLDPNVLAAGKEIGFTTDKNALHNVVNFLETRIGWDTPLYDAIYKGVKMAAGEPAGKRAVIVMTDGRDERDNAQGVPIKDAGSLSTPDDPINEANRHNIPIFSIGLVGMGGKIDTKYLQRLAERTGGVYQKAPKPEELAPLFQNVVNQLKHQYILTYDSTLPNDSAYHSLLIRVQLPQGQGFDEIKFQINPEAPPPPTEAAPPPASSPPPPAQTGGPSITPGPTPSVPTPTPTDFIGAIKTTVEENPWLLVLVSGVVVLLFLIIALLLLLFRGQKEEEEPPEIESVTPYEIPSLPPGKDTPIPENRIPVYPGRTDVSPRPPEGPGPVTAPPPPTKPTIPIPRRPKHLAILVDKANPEHKYDLQEGTTNIGRARGNQLLLTDPTVSRQHAWIKTDGEEYLIFDVGSANKTFVNDQEIIEPRRLKDGDVIRFGEIEFVFKRVF